MADDLFTRADEADAALAVETAKKARDAAARGVIGAPRCALTARRRELVTATAKLMAAEVELKRVQTHRRVMH